MAQAAAASNSSPRAGGQQPARVAQLRAPAASAMVLHASKLPKQLYHTPPAFPLAQTRHRHAQPRALVSPMPIYAKVISPIGAIANRANGCKASRSSLVATNTH